MTSQGPLVRVTPVTSDEFTAAHDRVDSHFRLYYRRGLDEYEITDSPGYWQRKEPCGGWGDCSSVEFHAGLGCGEPIRHTASYQDSYRDPVTGRWVSPYRSWRILRAAAPETASRKVSA